AAALAREGADKAPGDGSLGRAAAAFRGNFVATEHNHFAALFNAGDYAGAAAVAKAALARLPGDRTLQTDLDLAGKAQGQ
ncbi:MAG TPA: hypothetical protein VFL04_00955, partial [Rectinemataceae bacterium]|nr:hypothetical protein [Rectinemataceae bacterium]